MDYAQPLYISYTVNAADFTGAANTDRKIAGPKGYMGRVVSVAAVITTAVTVAASTVLVGTVADTDAYASLAVPIAVANTVANEPTIHNDDSNLIPVDTLVAIGNGGGSTAGVGDYTVTIAWFKAVAIAA